jgi:predicted  nucleic acid-binding Zn-ribbon protein
MGPTNVALVRLFQADQELREAQRRLDAVTKNVRLQQRKVEDLTARQTAAHTELNRLRARASEMELEAKSRDEKIESLRNQQAQAQTNREYQAFLVQINTQKVDKAKVEEELLVVMEQVEKLTLDDQQLKVQVEQETAKLQQMQGEIDQRVKDLTAEVASARPARDEAAEAVSPKARELFDRLAEKFDGEAMAPIEKPHPKREEYICSVCNLDLTVDVYNRLHTRDEPLMCPSGNHLLYIPEDLPPEKAVHKPKEKKAKGRKETDLAAPVQRQTLASSVVPSVEQDEPDLSSASSTVTAADTSTIDPTIEAESTSVPAPQEQSSH